MYYAESDTPARVRTMNLNEDLGQVSMPGKQQKGFHLSPADASFVRVLLKGKMFGCWCIPASCSLV